MPKPPDITIKVRSARDGSVHDCLLSAVDFARAQGYVIVDPDSYERERRRRDGSRVAPGDTIAPETAKNGGRPGASPMRPVAEQEETRFIPFG